MDMDKAVNEFLNNEGNKIKSEIIEILISNNLTVGKTQLILSDILSEINNESYRESTEIPVAKLIKL